MKFDASPEINRDVLCAVRFISYLDAIVGLP